MLKVENISIAYEDQMILEQISFELTPGSITAVIGPNGAGKSTLIRAISGVLPLHSGQISIMELDAQKLTNTERAKLIAVVPQAIQIPMSFSVWQTIILGRTPYLNFLGQLSEQDSKIAQTAMQRTNTLPLKNRLINELSGGEQQRVLLARAMTQSAPILLLDEPTAHLDLQYQIALLDQVEELAKRDNLSVLIAMHDLNLVSRYADQIMVLGEGKLQALGNTEQVLNADLLSKIYHIPLEIISLHDRKNPLILPKQNGKSKAI